MELDNDNNQSVILKIISNVFQFMIPLKMFLKLYSMIILSFDIAWVFINSVYVIFQTIFEIFRPPPLKSLKYETVMVIGSGRGVGREIALQVAFLGAVVICVDINKVNNDKTVDDAKARGGNAISYICDVTRKDNISKLATEIQNNLGFVSMVFYCCGIPSPRSLLTTPTRDVNKTLNLTLTPYFWIMDTFLPEMKNRNNGHIIALTSVAGLSHIDHQLPLSVVQFAVQGLAETLMEDLRLSKRDNVYITLIHIYPFVVSSEASSDLRFRIPSYFGTITPQAAATSILDSVRRNYVEASVPTHLLYLGHLLRILPRRATGLIRELLNTGVDFA